MYELLAPMRESVFGDPLAGFRAAMEAARPATRPDGRPGWQRVLCRGRDEAFRTGARVGDEAMALTFRGDFTGADVQYGGRSSTTPMRRSVVHRLLDG